jgi:hypothetical protein
MTQPPRTARESTTTAPEGSARPSRLNQTAAAGINRPQIGLRQCVASRRREPVRDATGVALRSFCIGVADAASVGHIRAVWRERGMQTDQLQRGPLPWFSCRDVCRTDFAETGSRIKTRQVRL